MRSIELSEAEISLDALLDAAEKGVPTTIMQNGRPSAVLMPVADAERLFGASIASSSSDADKGAKRDQTIRRKTDL